MASEPFEMTWLKVPHAGSFSRWSNLEWAPLLSLRADLRTLGVALFGIAARRIEPIAWPEAALVLALVAGSCLLILRARVRAVEVVT